MIKPNNKIIIIGTLPPPIGGVSIYNQRLYDFLDNEEGIEVDFIDYKRNHILAVLDAVLNHKIIYLNCSSSSFKFLIAVYAAIFRKKLVVAFHGNMGRHTGSDNLLDKLVLRLARLTVVLNKQSFDYALRYTRKVFLGTSFIPPIRQEYLNSDIKTFIAHCREKFKVICSSNAHNVSFDSAGNEIYQVKFLLSVFSQLPECCIILSDPSGMYSSYLEQQKVQIPSNVFIIKETHSYFELLKETDVMLRITTTDGDSISVREALYLHKIVIASNVVDRPAGVITVNISEEEILEKLREVMDGGIAAPAEHEENGGKQILKIFASLN
ncbi:MAG: glycosyltransferase [Flavipsychrobacter sp.]|jgi:hypothetical protein|nr:glycosyltransferase [Flavipsychrobacter sp.]